LYDIEKMIGILDIYKLTNGCLLIIARINIVELDQYGINGVNFLKES